MRLSDAVMLGRHLVEPKAGELRSCALGMGLQACGVRNGYYSDVRFMWPWTSETIRLTEYPCKCHFHIGNKEIKSSKMGVIAHLFDCHVMLDNDWTFEQLVDWIREHEPDDCEVPCTENVQASLEPALK